MRAIVTVSGGKASAWCAYWALNNFLKRRIIFYFNDTGWEHPDLYRFLSDLEKHLDIRIVHDADGRTPEQLFYDQKALANNRMPFCSRILKAKRLQKFYRDGDVLIFGIDKNERERAHRLVGVYQTQAVKTGRWPQLEFPLITENVTQEQVAKFLSDAGIEEPLLYRKGFRHNNCSGGCVRAGKSHWKRLYEQLPQVYRDRERVEEEVRKYLKKDVHFFKDETLKDFRGRIERGELSSYYNELEPEVECIGVCDTRE